MVKRQSKHQKATKARQDSKNNRVPKSTAPTMRAGSKQSEVIGLLTRPQGVTITTIMEKTGWQQHSVRGFFAGVVRKKLGLVLDSEKRDGADRLYRIVAGKAHATGRKPAKSGAAAKRSKGADQLTAAQ